MKLVDEITFFIDARKKAETAGQLNEFERRLSLLLLEGQVSDNAFHILRQIFGYTPVAIPKTPPKTINRTITTC